VGVGARVLIERAVGGDLPADSIDEALASYLAHYDSVCLHATRPYPGIEEMLADLSASYPLALLSNKGEGLSRKVLAGLGLAGYFRDILGGDSLPTRKPDPAGLLLLADRLRVPVQELMLVGDTRIDAETAQAAGCAFAMVEWGFPRPPGVEDIGADLRIAEAGELTRSLLSSVS
ncbi:MAG TPA: HAD-IA family hydrolase, partial [Thermoanaerobaculia bacterium]|nr:HAD-IA family hydrolase [Thermoanaerobaculia bacterium]